ncbi:MAG: DNA replication/repair protein RecF [Gammaproteobacteria bacterium]
MCLSQLHLLNFRSFKDSLFDLKDSVLVFGENGSGKTSFLEAIHFSLKSKSFRTSSVNSMINKDHDFFRISTKNKSDKKIIEKKLGKVLIKNNYEDFNKYDVLPLLINNFSLRFLEQNKEIRREFIDYFLFHVKHDYLEKLKRFKKILFSRNKALRENNKEQISVWTKFLIESSIEINILRERIVNEVLEDLEENILKKLEDKRWVEILSTLEISFFSGWKGDSLKKQLREEYEEDLIKGFTKSGAHKFDLEIKVLGEKSGNILSRGEQKLLILLVFLSFGEFFAKNKNKNLIYLIDDLASELDPKNLNLALQFLDITKGQKIITSVKKIENKSIKQLIDL